MTTPTAPPLVITRQPLDSGLPDADFKELGGSADWYRAVPAVFRVLAAPSSGLPMPTTPRLGQLQQACSYWNALQYLLTYSFGWTRLDLGLRRWIDAGYPSEDTRLQLIHDVWIRDGSIEDFIAYAATTGCPSPLAAMAKTTTPCRPKRKTEPHQEFVITSPAPSEGGYDPLHLSIHIDDGLNDREEGSATSRLLRHGSDSREVTLVCSSMIGWYAELIRATSSQLRQLEYIDYKVHVYARPVGYLGTYHQSRLTGLWFAGRHRHHSLGN